MITITTETKRITLKLSEEESSRMFDALVSDLLNLPKAELLELPKTELPKIQEPEVTEVTAPLTRNGNIPDSSTSNARNVEIP